MLEDSDLRQIRAIIKEEVRDLVDDNSLKYALNALEDRIVNRVNK